LYGVAVIVVFAGAGVVPLELYKKSLTVAVKATLLGAEGSFDTATGTLSTIVCPAYVIVTDTAVLTVALNVPFAVGVNVCADEVPLKSPLAVQAYVGTTGEPFSYKVTLKAVCDGVGFAPSAS